jgi:hypothetical protein
VFDAGHVRLGRIADKLAAARAMPVPPGASGVKAHGFKLGAPLPEAVVAEFEERHEVALPPACRLFVTGLGDGGAGPGYGLSRLSASCDAPCRAGHLARPSPYLPGPRYFGDWEERHEEAPGPNQVFLPGTLAVAYHGCSLSTQLVVTGRHGGGCSTWTRDRWARTWSRTPTSWPAPPHPARVLNRYLRGATENHSA